MLTNQTNRMTYSVCISIFLMIMAGCAKSTGLVTPNEYVEYVENKENGMIKHKEVGRYEFDLQYCPINYMIVKDQKEGALSNRTLEDKKSKLEGLQYLKFSISLKENDASPIDVMAKKANYSYQELIDELAYEFKSNFQLVEGKDTLQASLFHFERNYRLSPYLNFTIAFKRSKANTITDKVFVFDGLLLGVGPIKMRISKEDLARLPSMKLNQ